jgi:hypothetical protein
MEHVEAEHVITVVELRRSLDDAYDLGVESGLTPLTAEGADIR